MTHLRKFSVAIACLLLTTAAYGQRRGQIEEGSNAPGLDVEAWYNSEGVTIEAEKAYLVVFFEQGNLLSEVLMAVLDDAHEELSEMGLVIIGITTDDDEFVTRWMRSNGDQIKYAIGRDRRNSTERAWMGGAGQDTYPMCFIVGMKSKIQFIGSPLSEQFGPILDLVIDNRYDHQIVQDGNKYLRPAANARRVRDFRQCFMHLDKAIEMDKRIFAKAMLTKFEVKLLDQKNPSEAYKYAKSLIADNGDDPNFLNWLTEFIALDPRIDDADRDMDVALEAAQAAAKGYAKAEPAAYSVPALVHFHRGEFAEAIELQERAWLIARPRFKEDIWRILVSYKDAAKRQDNAVSAR